MDGKRHMETTEEYKLLLKFFEQPIEQMEWKYFEEKKFNCLHKASFRKNAQFDLLVKTAYELRDQMISIGSRLSE